MGIFVVSLSLHHSFLLIVSISEPSFPCGGEEGPACEGFSGPVPGGGGLSAGDKSFTGGLIAELS